MKVIKIILFIMALTIILPPTNSHPPNFLSKKSVATKRVSRFLQQKLTNLRKSDDQYQCRDNQFCSSILGGKNPTCCNNKCVETGHDGNNCGACGNKCGFTEVCCGGECVNLAHDERHCGSCHNGCGSDGGCAYGLCDYAN